MNRGNKYKKKGSFFFVAWCNTVVLLLILFLLVHNVSGDLYKFQDLDSIREQTSRQRWKRAAKYVGEINNLRGKSGQGYHIAVDIGTPKQRLNVLIDTGSSNFAVACADDSDISTYFKRELSSTYRDLGRDVHVPYTEGSWDGVLGNDVVSIPSLPNVTINANIACITQTKGFYINGSNWQGILGLGYANIARPDSSVGAFIDSLVQQSHIDNYFAMILCGKGFNSSDPDGELGGSLLFGGNDASLYNGLLYSTPINKEWYYEVVLVDIEVDHISLNMDCKEYNFGKSIVDSGTTNFRLPTKVFNSLIARMKTSVQPSSVLTEPISDGFWASEQVLCWDPGNVPYDSFPTVSLVLPVNKTAAFKLIVSSQQYMRPVGKSNDTFGQDCYKLAITSSDSGTVLGAVIMEGYYVVYNRAEKAMQFAESACNMIDPSAIRSSIQGNISLSVDYTDCAYAKISSHSSALTVVGYVMAGICGLCLLPLILLTLRWQCVRCQRSRKRAGSDFNGLVDNNSS